MAVELILLEEIPNLGKIGEVVRVAEGYARNYLVPKQLATKATPGALRQLEAKKAKLQEEYEKAKAESLVLADEIAKHSVTIPVQAGEDEKLFGSVTTTQIADALEEMNITLDRRNILLDEPIRKLGVYNVDVHLHQDVTATVKVWVVRA